MNPSNSRNTRHCNNRKSEFLKKRVLKDSKTSLRAISVKNPENLLGLSNNSTNHRSNNNSAYNSIGYDTSTSSRIFAGGYSMINSTSNDSYGKQFSTSKNKVQLQSINPYKNRITIKNHIDFEQLIREIEGK